MYNNVCTTAILYVYTLYFDIYSICTTNECVCTTYSPDLYLIRISSAFHRLGHTSNSTHLLLYQHRRRSYFTTRFLITITILSIQFSTK